ncbi:unnamed protein product [Dicrocoelium dendriticum]|nr:unnamed protein product [Dicrocoelium dendriticum]
MGLRDQYLRDKYTLKLPRSLEEVLEKARNREFLEQVKVDRTHLGHDSCSTLRPSTDVFAADHMHHSPARKSPVENCVYCQRFGRRAQRCGHNPPIVFRKPRGRSTLHNCQFLASTFTSNLHSKPLTIPGCLDDISVHFLIDTGASCSLLRLDIAHSLRNVCTVTSQQPRVITANGVELRTEFTLQARVKLDGVVATHNFIACRNLTWDAILGMDFLTRHGCTVALKCGTVLLTPTPTVIDHHQDGRGAFTTAATCSATSHFQKEVIEPIIGRTNVTTDNTDQLISVLREFEEVFSTADSPGRTNLVEHEIDTMSHRPIRQHARRLPVHYEPQLGSMIKEMLDKRIIKPSSSPWASPIVLVKKQDGTLRLCVDYRKLNEVTRKDSFPLPRIDATFDALHGSCWFSTLDLACGYWQVEVRPKDREKTAFTVPNGLYEFETMPFGLVNAPATFQRLMQKALEGLTPGSCLIYLDDIIVYGRSIEEHNRRLRLVLDRLSLAGLKLRGPKCHFLLREVKYLGHIISHEGVRTDPAKCEKITSWPQPKTTAELRSFLGLASYYRRFIFNFAAISAPLHRLTEKGRKFCWTNECQNAFAELKVHLTTPPILALPDTSPESGAFVLDTDASDEAIGAVLSQRTPAGEVVISYASRRLDKRERKYSTTRRELLALVSFLRHFRPYLLGKSFQVRTDHQSLQWLKNFREPEGQIARWQEQLQEYDFTCEYRPGTRHSNADALSRLVRSEQVNSAFVTPETDIAWAEEQACDPYIANTYNRQLNGSSKPTGTELRERTTEERSLLGHWKDLRIIDGVLYRVDKSGPKLITPMTRSLGILQKVHQQLGHSGQLKTEAAVRQRYWWPGIHADVVQFCASCELCATLKPMVPVPRAPLEPILTSAPGQRIGVDIIGPLPITKSGNCFILVMIDYFTKWCEAIPIRCQNASTVASTIVNEWVARYGAPISLHSDQGAAFESHLMQEMCRLLAIKKTRTTPYHPQGNGLVERTNRTIKAILQSFVERHQSNQWDEALPQCMLAYRASVHSTTGYSPAYLTLSREIRLPLELLSPVCPVEAYSLSEYVRITRERVRVAFQSVQEHMNRAQHSQKEYYDRQSRGPEYRKGDRVWLHRPRPPAGAPGKFHREWQGPYEIVFVRSPTVYVLRNVTDPSADVLTVHYNQLKPMTPSSSSTPVDRIVPPGCLPIVEHTVEVPAEGGLAVVPDALALGTGPHIEGGDNVVQLKPQCIV